MKMPWTPSFLYKVKILKQFQSTYHAIKTQAKKKKIKVKIEASSSFYHSFLTMFIAIEEH